MPVQRCMSSDVHPTVPRLGGTAAAPSDGWCDPFPEVVQRPVGGSRRGDAASYRRVGPSDRGGGGAHPAGGPAISGACEVRGGEIKRGRDSRVPAPRRVLREAWGYTPGGFGKR